MKTCLLEEFMDGLSSWLSMDLIDKVVINRNGQLVIQFADGATNVYRISDCTTERLEAVLGNLKEKGIRIDTG